MPLTPNSLIPRHQFTPAPGLRGVPDCTCDVCKVRRAIENAKGKVSHADYAELLRLYTWFLRQRM